MTSLHLAGIRACAAPGAHAALVIDGAGWHQPGRRLKVPRNVTRPHLPPCSPELDPAGSIWAHLRGTKLSNRVLGTCDAIVEARLATPGTGSPPKPDRIPSSGSRSWAQVSQ